MDTKINKVSLQELQKQYNNNLKELEGGIANFKKIENQFIEWKRELIKRNEDLFVNKIIPYRKLN